METNVVAEGGDVVISTRLRRTKDGLMVNVKVSPEVEELFRTWGGARTEECKLYGRMWKPVTETQQLQLWRCFQTHHNTGGHSSTPIFWKGGRLPMEDGIVDISFIRLVGASNPEGVTFYVDTLIGYSELDSVADKIKTATGWFYGEFVKPVELKIDVQLLNGGR